MTAILCSCASIDSVPLTHDGHDAQTMHGVRYYLPKPYLLVTELPVAPNPTNASTTGNGATALAAGKGAAGGGAGGGTGGAGGGGNTGGNQQGATSQPQTAAPSSSPADTSFSATMAQYAIKIVYLPDFSHPFALQMNAGLFGTASFAPSLQDGWMLTSLNGSSDNSSMLSAIASMVGGGGSGSGGGGAGKTATGAAAARAAPLATIPPADAKSTEWESFGESVVSGAASPVPPDTLNSLNASQLSSYISGITKATGSPVDPNVLKATSKANLVAFASSIGKVGQAVAIATAATQKALPWGNNVLPAGLYEFVYDEGVLTGLMPVTFFCKNYIETPTKKERDAYKELSNVSRQQLSATCNHD
jgi:hypothetical protein